MSNYAPYETPGRMRFLIGSILFLGLLLVVMGFAFAAKRVPVLIFGFGFVVFGLAAIPISRKRGEI